MHTAHDRNTPNLKDLTLPITCGLSLLCILHPVFLPCVEQFKIYFEKNHFTCPQTGSARIYILRPIDSGVDWQASLTLSMLKDRTNRTV